MNSLPVYDDRYVKTKITYSDKVYTSFCVLNVPEDDTDCESFTIIFIESVLVYKTKNIKRIAYLDNYVYKIVNTQMIGILYDHLLKSDEN